MMSETSNLCQAFSDVVEQESLMVSTLRTG
jgi:hypothetical protein